MGPLISSTCSVSYTPSGWRPRSNARLGIDACMLVMAAIPLTVTHWVDIARPNLSARIWPWLPPS
ncbi:hypothetical protein SBA3_4820006 [Candidatus Sulfopaludibacter sp. SbA3]|nr:hypothetical protein SBA3_4820006 [Candidatus Sulfopaludibacter sp. SbA3]